MYNFNCLVCENRSLVKYLDLRVQPLANSYHKGELLKKYPLQLQVCPKCWHSQLTYQVDPKEMFEHYLYVSDTSTTLTTYFKDLCDKIYLDQPYNSVLEIACNTGLFLEMFQNKGLTCYGVDPAENLREISKTRNLNVYVDYWGTKFANRFLDENGKVDLILAFHVLPHVMDPNEFIQACKTILSDTGKIYIQTSQCDMLINNEFDVVYHEHSSYFTANSILELAHRNGLIVTSIEKVNIHGKSYLFTIQFPGNGNEDQINKLINEESKLGLYSIDKYKSFTDTSEKLKHQLFFELNYYRQKGYTIVGYGAAAKGNTLLNYVNFKLDYIIDDNELKWGYLTPGMDIPIVGIDHLKQDTSNKICFVPLAWNFYTEIKGKIRNVRTSISDVFIRYFPNVVIETVHD